MSVLIYPFLGYGLAVFLWIKGTDPLANAAWRYIWIVLRTTLVTIGTVALWLALT